VRAHGDLLKDLYRLNFVHQYGSHWVPSRSSHILIFQSGDPGPSLSPATMAAFVDPRRHVFLPRADPPDCNTGGGDDQFFGLRVGSIFIILACATFGATFPVIANRSSWLRLPRSVFACVLLFSQ
jgi:hypothetical protein